MAEQEESNEQEPMVFNSIKDFVAHLKEDIGDNPDPAVQQYLHDIEYIGNIAETVREAPAGGPWHNAALFEILTAEAPAMVHALTANPLEMIVHPDAIVGRLIVMMEAWFIIGYMAGEGPDHIRQCTEGHGIEFDARSQN